MTNLRKFARGKTKNSTSNDELTDAQKKLVAELTEQLKKGEVDQLAAAMKISGLPTEERGRSRSKQSPTSRSTSQSSSTASTITTSSTVTSTSSSNSTVTTANCNKKQEENENEEKAEVSGTQQSNEEYVIIIEESEEPLEAQQTEGTGRETEVKPPSPLKRKSLLPS